MVDFDDAPDVFKLVFCFFEIIYHLFSNFNDFFNQKLNTASAPQFMLFGRSGKLKTGDNMDISRFFS